MKIFNVLNHVSHNYALYQLPDTEWYVLNNNIRRWNYYARPLPKITYVPYYEPGKYDVAVLHVDQQIIDPRIGKGVLYRDLNKLITDIPKVVINHGTPYWPENWGAGSHKKWNMPDGFADNEKDNIEFQKDFLINGGKTRIGEEIVDIEGMKSLIGNNTMVVNSYEARKQWGFGKVIWHGLDSSEWFDNPKELRSITQLSPAGLDWYYNRDLLSSTMSRLREDFGIKHVWMSGSNGWSPDQHPRFGEMGGFWSYRDYMSRSLVYFNPTKESPMPRSRTEAMLSGCCIVTTGGQDVEKFINFDTRKIWSISTGIKHFLDQVDELIQEDGINGIIVPENPLAIAALINYLFNHYKLAVKIGQEGKKTAQVIFSQERYNKDWTELLKNI
jgi:glycosyltransferase involved in cell wall biosynthesis